VAEVVNFELLGANIRQLQSAVRSLRDENVILNKRLDQIVERMATFESVVETRFDQMSVLIDLRFDQLLARMEHH
jgi:hypothetical protein